MASLLALLAAAAVAGTAIVAVYAPGMPLRGYVGLAALAGGAALAFTRPFLLVFVPYLAVLLEGRARDLIGPALYLGAFALAFVVTISGAPAAVATPIHRSERLVDGAGGLIFLVAGAVASMGARRARTLEWRPAGRWAFSTVLGATAGLLMYHELDPVYDSVFFATANAVPASHASPTVALFAVGLGAVYLIAGGATRRLVAPLRGGDTVLRAGRALSGLATALLGLAILTGRFYVVRTLLF
ncbi:MAG: hypothetical protein ACREJ9_18915 [Candidatus Rokuibacteriota bacterium]